MLGLDVICREMLKALDIVGLYRMIHLYWVETKDSAFGIAGWSGGSQLQKGGPEGLLLLSGYNTVNIPWKSLFQGAVK